MKRKSQDKNESQRSTADQQHQQTKKTTANRGHPIELLHRKVGNQAVRALYEHGDLQAKLEVSSPRDPAEREAERVAGEVMGMGEPKEEGASEVPEVQRSASGDTGGRALTDDAESQVRSSLGSGKPLPESTRSAFESRFGQDFSDVRVHTGPDADEAARSINAEAFTLRSDVAFARGKYDPTSSSGKKLLAHELVHVAQQNRAVSRASVWRQTFEEDEGMEVSGDRGQIRAINQSVDNIKENMRTYIDNWADSTGDAIDDFQRHLMFPDNVETDANVISALQNQIIEDVTSYGMGKVYDAVPFESHVQRAFGYANAMVDELERAETAQEGVTTRNFLNTLSTNFVNHFNQMRSEQSGGDASERYYDVIYEQANPTEAARQLEEISEEIRSNHPGPTEVQREITEAYINYMNQHDVLHIDGHLLIEYNVDDGQIDGDPTITLTVNNAEAVRDSMKETVGNDEVDTADLPITRKIRIEEYEGLSRTGRGQTRWGVYFYRPGSTGYYHYNGDGDLITEYFDGFPTMKWSEINTAVP